MNNKQSAILNITHSLVNKSINILYHYHSSLFDIVFKELDVNIFNYDGIHSYYYDIFISNNFLLHHSTTGEYARNHHIKDLLLFHSPPPSTFKKEDIQLVQQNTQNTQSIFFGQYLANTWKRNASANTHIIEYGIPKLEIGNNRNKPVLLLNLEDNPNVTLLHQYINKHFGGCDMLQDIPGNVSISDIANLISQYKVCIDTSSIINALIIAGCGCHCITAISWENNPLLVAISDYNDIINVIKNLLSSDMSEDARQHHAKALSDKYNYSIFQDQILRIMHNIKYKEIFWL